MIPDLFHSLPSQQLQSDAINCLLLGPRLHKHKLRFSCFSSLSHRAPQQLKPKLLTFPLQVKMGARCLFRDFSSFFGRRPPLAVSVKNLSVSTSWAHYPLHGHLTSCFHGFRSFFVGYPLAVLVNKAYFSPHGHIFPVMDTTFSFHDFRSFFVGCPQQFQPKLRHFLLLGTFSASQAKVAFPDFPVFFRGAPPSSLGQKPLPFPFMVAFSPSWTQLLLFMVSQLFRGTPLSKFSEQDINNKQQPTINN